MSSLPPVVLSRLAARRFLRRALALDQPLGGVGEALGHFGYVQIDPINICGRMHDLMLRHRVPGYRPGDLMRYLHGGDESSGDSEPSLSASSLARKSARHAPLPPDQRRAFEHHVPKTGILVAFPLEAWPHLQTAMHGWSLRRGAWAGRLTPRESSLATSLLAEIAHRGPLGSEDFDDPRRAPRVWGEAKLVKATLQKLFFHGRVLIAERARNRRRYDLPERVLPAAVLAQPAAPPAETQRWLARLKLRQRRLAVLRREEVQLLGEAAQSVVIEGCPLLHCLREDLPLLAAAEASVAEERRGVGSAPKVTPSVHLLAPLDPLIYDRRVTAALWDFDYTWEAYTPPQRRVRGYYALPVLVDTEIVGHVDPKADRAAGRLRVMSQRIRRGHRIAAAVQDFAGWLGLRR